jgi:hypothetical protein
VLRSDDAPGMTSIRRWLNDERAEWLCVLPSRLVQTAADPSSVTLLQRSYRSPHRVRGSSALEKPKLEKVDVGLGVLDRTVAGKLLNVTKAAACLGNEPCGVGNECAASGMRRAPVEPDFSI